MTQSARIVDTVQFRPGDGPKMTIPKGEVVVDVGRIDATLSWTRGDTLGSAAMPLTDFKRYVAQGAIQISPN